MDGREELHQGRSTPSVIYCHRDSDLLQSFQDPLPPLLTAHHPPQAKPTRTLLSCCAPPTLATRRALPALPQGLGVAPSHDSTRNLVYPFPVRPSMCETLPRQTPGPAPPSNSPPNAPAPSAQLPLESL